MRVAVVTHSSPYESRAEAVGDFFKKRGDRVTWVYADYDHLTEQTRHIEEKDHVYLHMVPYHRNLSLRRMKSVRQFGLDAGKYLDTQMSGADPFDLLYIMIPVNTLCAEADRLKKKYHVPVILDVIDLWLESLPINHISWLPPIRYWANLRDKHIGCADLIFTECRLYQDIIRLPKDKTKTLYWFKEVPAVSEKFQGAENNCREVFQKQTKKNTLDPNKSLKRNKVKYSHEENIQGSINIAYVGMINHIVDIDQIAAVLKALSPKTHVTVHIIGDGENAETLTNAVKNAGCEAVFYGRIFDEGEKARILSKCDFGLNMMVPGVKVGLTMKSLDYLSRGIPLINNIQGDTWDIVEREGCGVNVKRENPAEAAKKILKAQAYKAESHSETGFSQVSERKAAALNTYHKYFTREVFEQTLGDSLNNTRSSIRKRYESL